MIHQGLYWLKYLTEGVGLNGAKVRLRQKYIHISILINQTIIMQTKFVIEITYAHLAQGYKSI